MYYPPEKLLAPLTDMIITINREDSHIAEKFKVEKKHYIPGVGVDTAYIVGLKADRKEILKSLKIPEDAFVIITIGELLSRKN